MTGFLIVFHTIVSVLLITVVLMQASQGGGLSVTFGGNAASSMLGGQNAGNVLSRITTWLATLFLTLAVLIEKQMKYNEREHLQVRGGGAL